MRIWIVVCAMGLACNTAVGAGPTDINEIKYQRLAREFVTDNLKDPDSAQFKNQNGLCGEVNSKNSLGGYVGFQRFIAGRSDFVVFENDRNLARGAFDEVWAQFCR